MLTVPYLACPWPGFNMPSNWKDTPPELACVQYRNLVPLANLGCRYIHACELGGDGNHRLQKKIKRDDPDDVSLSEGLGYFVDREKMKIYLDNVDLEAAVRPHVLILLIDGC